MTNDQENVKQCETTKNTVQIVVDNKNIMNACS